MSREILDAVCRQTGAIPANSLQEMVDLVKALRVLFPLTGDGRGIGGGRGRQTGAIADAFSLAG